MRQSKKQAQEWKALSVCLLEELAAASLCSLEEKWWCCSLKKGGKRKTLLLHRFGEGESVVIY